ncbi:unnamed protein product, partial [Cuscuta campestris]
GFLCRGSNPPIEDSLWVSSSVASGDPSECPWLS